MSDTNKPSSESPVYHLEGGNESKKNTLQLTPGEKVPHSITTYVRFDTEYGEVLVSQEKLRRKFHGLTSVSDSSVSTVTCRLDSGVELGLELDCYLDFTDPIVQNTAVYVNEITIVSIKKDGQELPSITIKQREETVSPGSASLIYEAPPTKTTSAYRERNVPSDGAESLEGGGEHGRLVLDDMRRRVKSKMLFEIFKRRYKELKSALNGNTENNEDHVEQIHTLVLALTGMQKSTISDLDFALTDTPTQHSEEIRNFYFVVNENGVKQYYNNDEIKMYKMLLVSINKLFDELVRGLSVLEGDEEINRTDKARRVLELLETYITSFESALNELSYNS